MKRLDPPAIAPDPADTVTGVHGAEYPCADLAAVDGHLKDLCDRVTHAERTFPSLAVVFREDVDLLLDRRCWLQLRVGSPEDPVRARRPGVAVQAPR